MDRKRPIKTIQWVIQWIWAIRIKIVHFIYPIFCSAMKRKNGRPSVVVSVSHCIKDNLRGPCSCCWSSLQFSCFEKQRVLVIEHHMKFPDLASIAWRWARNIGIVLDWKLEKLRKVRAQLFDKRNPSSCFVNLRDYFN